MSKENIEKLLKSIEKTINTPSVCNEWDNVVPLVSDGHNHTVFITEEIGTPSNYNQLVHKLVMANEFENFHLIINSPGGILDSALMVVDAIGLSKAKVTCRLVGTVASAATIIALCCDELVVSNDLAFMVHNYSAGMQGKGHEMKARQLFLDKQLNRAFESYYLGFLTKEEIEDVIEGKDIWMDSIEVKKRWCNKNG